MPIYSAAEILKILEQKKTILCVGPPFTGKTRSLWTLVAYLKEKSLGPLHIFDLDNKVESLVVVLQEKNLLDNLVVHQLTAASRLSSSTTKATASKSAFEDFQRQFNELGDKVDTTTAKWKSDFQCGAIIIDSLTRYNEIVMEFVVASVGHDIGAANTDARNDFSRIMNKVKQTVDTMKAFPCITGWIAHDQIVRSEFDGKIVLVPNVTGQNTLAPSLAKEFNCVLYSTTEKEGKNIKYVWQVQPEGWVRSAGVTKRADLPTFIDQDYRKIL